MIARLICRLFGHQPFVYDELPDRTKIRGCDRCGSYVRRDTSDPRPMTNPNASRHRMPAREQHELRHRAVRLLRKLRITRERSHLTGIDGGRAA